MPEDLALLKAVTARAAGVDAFTRIRVADLAKVRDWLTARAEEVRGNSNPNSIPESTIELATIPSDDSQTLFDLRRELVVIEAAIQGADMGDKELQEALACTLLDVLKMLQPADTANTHRLDEGE